MKLRLRHNSIRLRLLRNEVEAFSSEGEIAEEILFPGGGRFVYRMVKSREAVCVTADVAEGHVTVSVPVDVADGWASSDDVSISAEVDVPGGSTLRILVEKDFVCLDRKDDPDNADAFPHPKGNC
jgi:hypothetical protein